MHDVFISYSTQNQVIADAICHRLEADGIRCWYAPRNVQPGKGWAGEIMRAIEGAKVFLLIYSKEYNQSQQVLNELTAAVDAKCTIVPFRVDTSDMNDDLAYYLKKVHWLDALNPPTKQQIDALSSHICTILHREKPVPSDEKPVTPVPETGKKRRRLPLVLGFVLVAAVALVLSGLGRTEEKPEETPAAAEAAVVQKAPVQEIDFVDMSRTGNYTYPFYSNAGLSRTGEMIALKKREDGSLTIGRTDNGSVYLSDLEFVFDDPLRANISLAEGYNTVYFLDFANNTIMSYDRGAREWLNRKGTKLELSPTEYIMNVGVFEKNMLSANEHMEELLVMVYDGQPEVDCISKVIYCQPDGTYTALDIAHLELKQLITGINKPGCDGFLMLDKSSNLRVFDSTLGQTLDVSHQDILEEYMPYTHENNSVLCGDKRYIFTAEGYRTMVWDLETGTLAFERTFADYYSLYFSGAHEIAYLNGEDDCVYTYDLETGRETKRLDKTFFENSSAFLGVPYNFYYSDEYDVCIFVTSSGYEEETMKSTDMVTVTDLDGNILGKSGELETYNGGHYGWIYVQEEMIIADFTAVDITAAVEDDVYSYLFRASFSVDDQGNLVFAGS